MDGLAAHLYFRYLLIDGSDLYRSSASRPHPGDRVVIFYKDRVNLGTSLLKKDWNCTCCVPEDRDLFSECTHFVVITEGKVTAKCRIKDLAPE